MPLTPPSAAPTEKQQIRRAVLAFLADRQALQFTRNDILGRLVDARKFDFTPTPESIDEALVFIEGQGWAKRTPSASGPAIFFQATSAGVLAIEQDKL